MDPLGDSFPGNREPSGGLRRGAVHRADADSGLVPGAIAASRHSQADLLRNYPTLRAEDLANAWAYVRAPRRSNADLENEGT